MNKDEQVKRPLRAYSPRLQAIVETSRKEIREGDVLTHEEFWAEVEASRTSAQSGRSRPRAKKPPRKSKP